MNLNQPSNRIPRSSHFPPKLHHEHLILLLNLFLTRQAILPVIFYDAGGEIFELVCGA